MSFDNLWKCFVLLPGTRWPRLALTAWEAVLGGIVYACARLIESPWLALVGFPLAFAVHEVAFRAWVHYVARIPDADDGDVVGRDKKAVLTLERWIGPVR